MFRLLWSAALLALGARVGASALTFQVEPKKTLCIYEELPLGSATASWEVVRGGLLDVNIAVRCALCGRGGGGARLARRASRSIFVFFSVFCRRVIWPCSACGSSCRLARLAPLLRLLKSLDFGAEWRVVL